MSTDVAVSVSRSVCDRCDLVRSCSVFFLDNSVVKSTLVVAVVKPVLWKYSPLSYHCISFSCIFKLTNCINNLFTKMTIVYYAFCE